MEIPVTGAGRTDTGVNASHYVAHFDIPVGSGPEPDCRQLCYKLNAILPKSISIKEIIPVGEDFHARFGATRREYTYFLHRCKDPFVETHSWQYCYPNVDFNAMNEAARALLGRHDFSSFEKTGGDNRTSICTVTKALWERYEPEICTGGEYWKFTISADRFLRNMVRAIVGTLLEVGRGKRSIADFEALVFPAYDSIPEAAGSVSDSKRNGSATASCGRRATNRSQAGESVPGHALFLSGIDY